MKDKTEGTGNKRLSLLVLCRRKKRKKCKQPKNKRRPGYAHRKAQNSDHIQDTGNRDISSALDEISPMVYQNFFATLVLYGLINKEEPLKNSAKRSQKGMKGAQKHVYESRSLGKHNSVIATSITTPGNSSNTGYG